MEACHQRSRVLRADGKAKSLVWVQEFGFAARDAEQFLQLRNGAGRSRYGGCRTDWRQGEGNGMVQGGIAHADWLVATLAHDTEDDLADIVGRALKRHRDANDTLKGLYRAEELVLFALAMRVDRFTDSHSPGVGREVELVPIHVVARRNHPNGLDCRGRCQRGRKGKRLLGFEQFIGLLRRCRC